MNRHFSVLVLAMIAMLLSERGFAQGRATAPVEVHGWATASCGTYVRAVEEERAAWALHGATRVNNNQFLSPNYMYFVATIEAWITATNYIDGHNYQWPDRDSRMLLAEQSCRRDPTRIFFQALREIDDQRSRFRSP